MNSYINNNKRTPKSIPDAIKGWLEELLRPRPENKEKVLVPIPVRAINRLLAVAFLFLALSACEQRTTEQQRSPDMETMGSDPAKLTERERRDTVPGVGAERVVDLEAKDHVFFPQEIVARPGEQFYINLINGGNEGHNVAIHVDGAAKTFGDPVPTGESRKILVNAPPQPGRYEVYCPMADHRQRGMEATLIVEE